MNYSQDFACNCRKCISILVSLLNSVLSSVGYSTEGQFIIYGDDRVRKSETTFFFFPNAHRRIISKFQSPS